MHRLIDCGYKEMLSAKPVDLIESVRLSEGRVIAAELISEAGPLIDKVSNAELYAAWGADILVFNLYDCNHPRINGLPGKKGRQTEGFGSFDDGQGCTLMDARQHTGRIAAANLEPIPNPGASVNPARLATAKNAIKLAEQGAQIIIVTGNPGSGVTMAGIAKAISHMKAETGDSLLYFGGRIHGAGAGHAVVAEAEVETLAKSGASGIVLPAPGTTPGSTLEASVEWVNWAHSFGLLAWNGIGTSQEGASVTTIEQIALMSKMSGADIHHIGDSGYFGLTPPENLYAYSIAIRGKRHTWHRMAASHLR